jgi:hypothetical protein
MKNASISQSALAIVVRGDGGGGGFSMSWLNGGIPSSSKTSMLALSGHSCVA